MIGRGMNLADENRLTMQFPHRTFDWRYISLSSWRLRPVFSESFSGQAVPGSIHHGPFRTPSSTGSNTLISSPRSKETRGPSRRILTTGQAPWESSRFAAPLEAASSLPEFTCYFPLRQEIRSTYVVRLAMGVCRITSRCKVRVAEREKPCRRCPLAWSPS